MNRVENQNNAMVAAYDDEAEACGWFGPEVVFGDLSPVFAEAARILRKGGLFAFVVGDRAEGEAHEVKVGPEHTKSERTVMMYRHSPRQIDTWLERYGFELVRSLAFTVFMDRERTRLMPVRAYLAQKGMSVET